MMSILSLMAMVGLVVVAGSNPQDFSRLCSSAQCPGGWKNVSGDCIMFAGWDQAKAKEVCRKERAEYKETKFSFSAAQHLLPICFLKRDQGCQPGIIITGGSANIYKYPVNNE